MKDPLKKVLEIGTFLSFTGLILVVLFQVITRFAFPAYSKVWTEEATRLFFVYSIAFAAPLAMKNGEYVNVDILTNLFPKSIRVLLELASRIVTVFLFVTLAMHGYKFVELGMKQLSPTMNIPMAVAYSSIMIAIVFVGIYAVIQLITYVYSLMKRGEQ